MTIQIPVIAADELTGMSFAARVFIGGVLTVGAGVAILVARQWSGMELSRFFVYLTIAIVASGMKVGLPGLNGTMSVNLPFILMAVIGLDPAQAVLVGCCSTAAQSLVKVVKGFTPIQMGFNLANSAIAVYAAQAIFRLPYAAIIPSAFRVVLAAATYFALNTGNVATVIALTQNRRPFAVWHEFFFWSYPYYLSGAVIAVLLDRMTRDFGLLACMLVLPVLYAIYHAYRVYLGRLNDQVNHAAEMTELHMRTIEALALAIEAKDQTTHRHLNRVRTYACLLAEKIALSEKERDAVRAAALLHDIGKLAVPEHIISKPGRLTPEEFEKMKIHPIVGANILKTVNFPYPVVPIVRAHHERWDGSGYPDGLKGDEIPVGARIISIVDCFDAIASDRQYRRAMTTSEALAFVDQEAGKSFDPAIVRLFVDSYQEFEDRFGRAQESRPSLKFDLSMGKNTAPGAGFEAGNSAGAAHTQTDFLSSIAAARQEAQTLYEISLELGNVLSLDEALGLLGIRLERLVPFDSIAIFIEKSGVLYCQFAEGEDRDWLRSLSVPVGEGVIGWVVANNRSIVNANPQVESSSADFSTGLRAVLAVPMQAPGGMRAAIALYQRKSDSFQKDHQRIVQAVASKLATIVENAITVQAIQRDSVTDFVTGLPNTRALFVHLDREIARAQRDHGDLAVVSCDLNGFKRINDQHGHLEGNRILVQVGREFRSVCRAYDCVARMGGDEFVLVLPGLGGRELEPRLQDFREAVGRVGRESPSASHLTVSMGAAQFPHHGMTAEELLAYADQQMYRQKFRHHAGTEAGSQTRLEYVLR